ncbi:MAG: alpha-2-macroglobulin family protein [Alphaproteobacteria bacterium]|nr:alpha-2-macroglobulin family protein [Alphaproteobacteria bacterium]
MQRVLIVLAVVVALTAAIFLSVKYVGQQMPVQTADDGTITGTTSGTTGTTGTTTPVTATPEPPAPYFAFRRLEVQTSGEEPEACLVFTRKLDDTGATKYEDYLKFDPEAKIAVRVTQDRLCIQGLVFGQTYQLELKPGLPAVKVDGKEQEKLTKAETLPVELRDKPSLVRFGNGLVLPRDNVGGVPITTVNVAKLDVKVVRVGDRLLSQLQTGVVDQREFYDYERTTIEGEQGQVVWTGQLTVPNNRRNDEAITLFPLRTALKEKQPGAYLIIAQDSADKGSTEENVEWKPRAAQFVVDTDLGLTTFKGKDGLSVFVRSLKSAGELSGVNVALVARNNEELMRVRTDGDGRAVFPAGIARGTGGSEPVVVMAYGANGDFTFLDLRRPAFDLTDRGVEGRASPEQIDAYLYTDRGVYRPAETVNVVTLLRDQQAKALGDTQLNFVLSRPDGLEAKKWVVNDLQAGGISTPVTLTATAPRGRWQVAAYIDPKGEPIGRVAFDVQDFVPQKLKVELKPADKILRPGNPVVINVNGRFLYGAPAAGLGGEGTMTITSDSDPFASLAALKGYRFGKVDDTFEGTQVTMSVPETDAAGKTQATAAIDELAETSLALKALINVAIYEPGGRTTADQVTLPVRTRDTMIGVRPAFEWDSIQENTPANFEVLAVDAEGKPKAVNNVTWELVNEDIDYRWYQVDNDWKYERVVNDRIVDGGRADLDGRTAFKVSKALPWGSYRLTVADPSTGATTAYRFWSGWGSGATNDRPDRVAVATDKTLYASGESAKVSVNPPSDGKALIVVASNKIHFTREITVSASGTSISIPVSSDWGAGAYVLVTHYRPLSSAQTRAPVRSIGVAWLGVDPAPRTLQVSIKAEKKVPPSRKVTIPVEVKNQGSGEAVYLTLAAVDEGILQLTDFNSPNPNKHYFDKRRLGLDMRDDYGRLISGDRAVMGELRTGGDGVGGRSLAVVPQRTVSLFSGLVALDSAGKGSVTFDVPDFNGELRLMAVAYTNTKLGHAEQPLTVRDAVVAEVILPRFMAPGDKIMAALNMHNVEGAPGQYVATVKSSGSTASPGGQTRVATQLGAGERKLLTVPVEASTLGIGQIALNVTGPNGFKIDRSWPIEVREPQLPVSAEDVAVVGPGRDNKFGKELLASFKPGTAQVAVTVTGGRGFDDVPGLLRWLDRYPYGCIEQTTSRAFPLVYYNDLALLANVKQDKNIKDRVQDAAYRILDMQTYAGSFGMWSSISGEADAYIGMFATDFLMQAKEHKYVIPEEGVERALKWARKAAGTEGNTDLARAYGFYLLARAGTLNPSELRYFADTRVEGMTNPFALGLMGAALSNIGDRARAAPAFAKARDLSAGADPKKYVSDTTYYGSLLRDIAGLTAMSAKAGQAGLIPALVGRVQGFDPRLNYTTTQEKAWMLLAAHEVEEATPPVNVAVTGATVNQSGKVLRFSPTLAQMDTSISLKNNGQKDVWRIVSAEGIPAAPLPASQNGVTISKAILTMAGAPANLASVKQNDRFIVRLSGEMADNRARLMALLDLLPAGFEIEGVVQRKDDGSTIYPFLPVLAQSNIAEARDDRFVVTFDIGSNYQPTDPKEIAKQTRPTFHFAYIVRATVPGSYVVPAASVEDMYAPDIQARTNMGQMTIGAN